jgi:hypothetical protein
MASAAAGKVVVEGGKDLKVLKHDGCSLFRVGFDGGGVVPKELEGFYTSVDVAQKAITAYLARRG